MSAPALERCRHKMVAMTCSVCAGPPQTPARRPQARSGETSHGRAALPPKHIADAGLAVVTSKKNHPSFGNLRPGVRVVHINGHPFVWLIEIILRDAPDVQVIQVIPTALRKVSETHRALCEPRGVVFQAGHCRPELAWDEDRFNVTESFAAQRKFLDGLAGEQKALYDELLAFGFEEAEIVRRYFGPGEDIPGVTQQELADEFGLRSNASVSYRVQGVLLYLDPTFQTGEVGNRIARGLTLRVARLRDTFAEHEAKERVLQRLGVESIPEGMPLERVLVLESVLAAQKSGGLALLRRHNQRQYEVVCLRYGLLDGWRYKRLKEIGERYGVSRERIRQLEAEAFAFLGIEDSGSDEASGASR